MRLAKSFHSPEIPSGSSHMGKNAAAGRTELFFSGELLADVPPIARPHLHDELRERLRNAIINGELTPDTKVPEKKLCKKYGVSRTPLREALKVLAHEGLVLLHHNRGAMVRPLSAHDLEEVIPIYAQLESLAGELACTHATDDEIGEIRQMHEEMAACFRSGDLKRHFEINELIHERIQQCAHNATLAKIMHTVSGRIRRARIQAGAIDIHLADAIGEHERILAALEARDSVKLAQLLRAHMDSTLGRFKEALALRAAATGGGRMGWRHNGSQGI